jgi:hypothetical protein
MICEVQQLFPYPLVIHLFDIANELPKNRNSIHLFLRAFLSPTLAKA